MDVFSRIENQKARAETHLRKVLIVDLNNFARFPTISVGYLAAVCRDAGMRVAIFSPLSVGLLGVEREVPVRWYGLHVDQLNYRLANSRSAFLRSARKTLARAKQSVLKRGLNTMLAAFEAALDKERPDVVLVSTYLMYRAHTVEVCRLCKKVDIPVVIGGPYFGDRKVAEHWTSIDGVMAVVGGEVELELPQILDAISTGSPLKEFPGLWIKAADGKTAGRRRQPLIQLDAVPFPDYRDFPWKAYPNRIVPIVTGRGCGWGACRFCSDVTSTAGRTFRSRTPENVLAEIKRHYHDFGVKLFTFTDLKLNSDLRVWHAILCRMQDVAPGSSWTAAVHVDAMSAHRMANGLTRDELIQARASGCVRLTTGLESGSQRMLDLMKKGTRIDRTSLFIEDAHEADISVRCTMILGFPGEFPDDVAQSAAFLGRHHDYIERVVLNRFNIMTGTRIDLVVEKRPYLFPDIGDIERNDAQGEVSHFQRLHDVRAHRREVYRLLKQVHRINRKPLRAGAKEFEGAM